MLLVEREAGEVGREVGGDDAEGVLDRPVGEETFVFSS